MWDVFSQLATDPTLEFFFKLAPIVTGIVVAITFFLNYTSYTKIRMMDQIKLAQDFFKDYREFKNRVLTSTRQILQPIRGRIGRKNISTPWNGSPILLIQSK